jgi:hypothetical protein
MQSATLEPVTVWGAIIRYPQRGRIFAVDFDRTFALQQVKQESHTQARELMGPGTRNVNLGSLPHFNWEFPVRSSFPA